MLEQISPLWSVYLKNKQHGRPLVLATLIKTNGSSYKKAGAMMLIETDRSTHGMLSGGCLEADVAEHALTVFETKKAVSLTYDLSDDSIFGFGAGCDGSVKIVLQLIDGDYLPFSSLNPLPKLAKPTTVLINSEQTTNHPLGSYFILSDGTVSESSAGFYKAHKNHKNTLYYEPPPKIAICGTGIDAWPLVEILSLLHWHVYLIDHSLTRLEQNPHHQNTETIHVKMTELSSTLASFQFDAALIMSHSLDKDATYLKHFKTTETPWLGLLGPTQRRDKILKKIDTPLNQINNRLHAPVGLDIGGQMSENIAVSVVAQLQHHFYKELS